MHIVFYLSKNGHPVLFCSKGTTTEVFTFLPKSWFLGFVPDLIFTAHSFRSRTNDATFPLTPPPSAESERHLRPALAKSQHTTVQQDTPTVVVVALGETAFGTTALETVARRRSGQRRSGVAGHTTAVRRRSGQRQSMAAACGTVGWGWRHSG